MHRDPHQSDKLDPEPHPHQLADDKPKCMEYEPIWAFQGLNLNLKARIRIWIRIKVKGRIRIRIRIRIKMMRIRKTDCLRIRGIHRRCLYFFRSVMRTVCRTKEASPSSAWLESTVRPERASRRNSQNVRWDRGQGASMTMFNYVVCNPRLLQPPPPPPHPAILSTVPYRYPGNWNWSYNNRYRTIGVRYWYCFLFRKLSIFQRHSIQQRQRINYRYCCDRK